MSAAGTKEEENDMLTRAETQEQLETDGLPVADFLEEETGGETPKRRNSNFTPWNWT